MKSKKKRIILMVSILFLLLIGSAIFIIFQQTMSSVNEVFAEEFDLSHIADGTYIGEYTMISLVHVEVEVTVSNHSIEGITILQHENGLGGKAESITGNIIEKQSLEVDAVSGATVSSKTIIKAVENALLQGIQE